MYRESGAVTVPANDDAELAQRAANGDQQAFGEFYARYAQRLFTYTERLTRCPEDAQDAVQETFTKLLAKVTGRGPVPENFAGYVFTVARNAAYDVMRKRGRAEFTDQDLDVAEAEEGERIGPETAALVESVRGDVRAAQARLPQRQREVLVLREVEELSYDEIARVMGMNSNSVAQLIMRARTALRRELRIGALRGISAQDANCERALALLSRAADGELSNEAEAGELAGHLAGCSRCAAGREELAEVGRRYRALAPLPLLLIARDAFAAAYQGSGRRSSARRRIARALVVAGVGAVAAVAGAAGIATDHSASVRGGVPAAAHSSDVQGRAAKLARHVRTHEGRTTGPAGNATRERDGVTGAGATRGEDGTATTDHSGRTDRRAARDTYYDEIETTTGSSISETDGPAPGSAPQSAGAQRGPIFDANQQTPSSRDTIPAGNGGGQSYAGGRGPAPVPGAATVPRPQGQAAPQQQPAQQQGARTQQQGARTQQVPQ